MPKTTTTVDTKSSKSPAIPPPAISYKLSEKVFLDMGWTTQSNISVAFPVVTMRARFSHSVISPWFQERNKDVKANYQDGKTLYIAKKDGTGKIYYPNGKVAVKIDKGGADNFRTRVWVYSSGEVDRDGIRRPSQLCALFDSLGCGVVYDSCMKKRVVYNQTDGVLWDSPNGLPIRWKWHNFKYSGPLSVADEENSEVSESRLKASSPQSKTSRDKIPLKPPEFATSSVSSLPASHSQKLTPSDIGHYVNTAKIVPKEVSPIKPIILQLNRYMALRIWDQTDISLTFSAKGYHTQIKIGVLYNPYDKLKVTEVEDFTGEKAFCPFETFAARTRSMQRFKNLIERIRIRCSHKGVSVK